MYLMDSMADAAFLVRTAGNNMRNDPLLSIFPKMEERLKGTPRFLLDENAIHTAVELTLGRPKVLLDAMRHLRIPYPALWVEWPEVGRTKLRETFGDQGYVGPDRPLPQRLGFFVDCADNSGRKGQVTWVWTSPAHELLSGDFPNVGAVSAFFDLDGRIDQPSDRIAGFLRGNLAKLWMDHPVQLEALFDIWRTAEHALSEWGLEYCSILQRQGVLERQLPHMWADVYGEYIIIWAVLLLLTSSRKAVEYRPVDRSKVNKLRAKRRQAMLFDHTQVVMYLGQHTVQGQRRQPLSYARKSPRIHYVSSYLARRGDLHWIVAPYIRGSGEWVSRHIRVKGSSAQAARR